MNLALQALEEYGNRFQQRYADDVGVMIPKGSNWCAVFIGSLLSEIGYDLPAYPQVARSYLKIGRPVDDPVIGDIVVFWRGSKNDWRGHVSIFIREDETGIYCLGGNQQGKVQIVRYSKFKLLGYRRIQDEY